MIQRDENGDLWLLCDLCVGSSAHKGRASLPQVGGFYAIGLSTARQIRGAAKALEGWHRRKLITRLDPLDSAWFDLCPACQQAEILGMRLVAVVVSTL